MNDNQKEQTKPVGALKNGREEIVCLLTAVFEKYENATQHELIRNTNKKNYEEIAKILSTISNQLPYTAETLGHEHYPPDRNDKNPGYPYLKYDITGGQVRDAYNGIVNRPRPFLVEACYIYLFGVSRNAFEKNPLDKRLLEEEGSSPKISTEQLLKKISRQRVVFGTITLVIFCLGLFSFICYQKLNYQYSKLTKDLNLLPYQPTAKDIKELEGIWLAYIGSPQARVSDDNRYHQIVCNIIDVKYNNGYFTFKRYGANFNHTGYMQFESAKIVSIHSYLNGKDNSLNSPRLSLLRLDNKTGFYSVISASWNFDIGENNDIIGIREVFIKKGKGEVEEIINTIENSSCKCKIIKWKHDGKSDLFYLKNMDLESISDQHISQYLDEKSILLRDPTKNILLSK